MAEHHEATGQLPANAHLQFIWAQSPKLSLLSIHVELTQVNIWQQFCLRQHTTSFPEIFWKSKQHNCVVLSVLNTCTAINHKQVVENRAGVQTIPVTEDVQNLNNFLSPCPLPLSSKPSPNKYLKFNHQDNCLMYRIFHTFSYLEINNDLGQF